MEQLIEFLLMLVVLLGLASLGTSVITRGIWIVGAQGIAIGALFIVTHVQDISAHVVLLAALSVAVKGFVIPRLLLHSLREADVKREVEPYVGFSLSLVLGIAAIGVAFGLASLLPPPLEVNSPLIVSVSLATVFMGLLLLVSRRKAVTQVVGYLQLENGIFVFSLGLASSLPTLVEMGVLLDVFAGAFVMGITIFQINREFDHIDTDRLRVLHDLGRSRRRPRNGIEQPIGRDHGVVTGGPR